MWVVSHTCSERVFKSTSLCSAINWPMIGRLLGEFCRPRKGTGAKYGESVSIINRSIGVSSIASRFSWAFLKVTIPEKDSRAPD